MLHITAQTDMLHITAQTEMFAQNCHKNCN